MYVSALRKFQRLKTVAVFLLLIFPIRHRIGGGKLLWSAVTIQIFHWPKGYGHRHIMPFGLRGDIRQWQQGRFETGRQGNPSLFFSGSQASLKVEYVLRFFIRFRFAPNASV